MSKNNIYRGTTNTLVQRSAATTSLSFLGDTFIGGILTDTAIATDITILINRCNLSPDAAGNCITFVNAANKAVFTITNNIITQTVDAATLFTIKCYDLTFTGNTINGEENQIIIANSLAAARASE